jgi:hypothetical protein
LPGVAKLANVALELSSLTSTAPKVYSPLILTIKPS